jgi:serine/threonine protein kinase/class 3 adenylate cyclase
LLSRSRVATIARGMDPRIALDHRAQVEEFQRRHRTALVTMLFSDIVGSTNLKQTVGDRGAIDAIQRHHAVFREILSHFEEGAEIGTAGDSFFIFFTKPSDAVKFSLLIQARLRRLATETGYPLFDRIGIHVGEVWVKKTATLGTTNELYGIQVDTCARVSSLGDSDQILLTRFAFDSARQVLKGEDIENMSPLLWLNHGPYIMKGVDESLEVCEVGEIGKAKLALPADTEKAHRFISADSEPVLGWRPAVDQPVPGTSWVLEKKLGEGGFGEVWSGHDKVLKTRHVFKFCFRADRVRSLKREVTLFGLLNERIGAHPSIVAVERVYFDEPPFYIVMQYVEGNDLATWCEAQGGIEKVPLTVRLEIVARVADALQAAHDSGIIHRDVKPSNILVSGYTLDDLNVHLTDFGIGQVVSREILAGMTKQLGFTETMMGKGSQSGTYMYMAPELLRGEPASPASDIYSLVVVLFQLLAGDLQRPLTADWAEAIAEPLLREDLSRGLATDPAERFASAEDFAKALRSLPARRADIARREADARTSEIIFQRRRKRARVLQLIGAAAVCMIVVAWVLQRQQRASQEVRKSIEALLATQTENQLLRAIMEYPKVEAQVKGSKTKKDPAEIQKLTYSQLGKQLGVDPKILREKLPQFAEQQRQSSDATTYERANASIVAGDYSEAERLFRSVIEERTRTLGPEHPDTLDSRHRLIYALTRQIKYAEAEAEARQVLKLREKVLGPEDVDTLVSRSTLADTLVEQGKNAEAETLYREVIRLDEKVLGPEDPRTIAAHLGLATVLSGEGKNAEAEPLYREVIKLDEKVYGPEHPKTLNARQDLATVLQADGKYAEAEAEYREVIKLEAKVIGTEHPDILVVRMNLADLLDDEGKFAEAEAECRQIISLAQKVLGPENHVTLNTRGNLAVALIGQEKFPEAEVQYRDVLKLMERVLGPEHPDTFDYTERIAKGLARQNKIGEAIEIAKGAEDRAREVLGPDNPSTQKYAKLVQDMEASR